MAVLEWILTAFVIAGGLPLVAGCYQFVLAGLHRFRRRSDGELEREPNVAVVVPAWNEAFVIGRTIDTLVALDYPAGATARLRRRRRQHGRDARRRAREGRRVPGARLPPAPRQGRRGQGAHAQPRAARDPRRGLVRGGADHRRRRDLHVPLAAPDGAPPRRSQRRRGHGVHQGGQPARQLHEPLHLVRVHQRAGRAPAVPRTCSARRRASRAARSCCGARASRRSAARSTPRRSPRTRSPRSTCSSPAGAWSSSRTRSCGPRSRATSPGCGSSGCAGAAATSRSRCATGAPGCAAAPAASAASASR